MKQSVEPTDRTQMQQLNSLTIPGVTLPSVAFGDALEYMTELARQNLPKGYGYDYPGEARQYANESSALTVAMFMSLLVIYLVLAAQLRKLARPGDYSGVSATGDSRCAAVYYVWSQRTVIKYLHQSGINHADRRGSQKRYYTGASALFCTAERPGIAFAFPAIPRKYSRNVVVTMLGCLLVGYTAYH